MPPSPIDAWRFLLIGYVCTVLIETPVLLAGLSAPHSYRIRLAAGLWLTACTYPIVVLVLPWLVWQPWGHMAYLVVAETFAPLAECVLFQLACGVTGPGSIRARLRDWAAIVLANLASFAVGQVYATLG
jgi:hypothetical protein